MGSIVVSLACCLSKGPCTNHVDHFLDFFDPLSLKGGSIYSYDVDHYWRFSTPSLISVPMV